ncbi:CYTH domain-containing protein [Anaerocolumna sp. MB42-C2]|uniref:CYTH domain-containing protein n=1 Tax=Anaerocolumna sp. MB42-C2 TaxID=3070997 RepID=UPI0027E13801|nr:CYTH domain-containing protein [Anaerocolumna sp. MB42-C2]WMJ88581.1 CYTH domain-containing protein [Anaerocolumna sp. MB42-C2]
MEIERKFKIIHKPEGLNRYHKKQIEQGYLCTDPVIRIRKSNEEYYLTYKSRLNMKENPKGIALACEEVELPLSKEAYEHLRNKVDDHLITKTRYLIPIGNNYIAELDEFHGSLEGLIFVEVEFPDEEKAEAFQPPEWFGKDVSFDKRYKNNYLATINSLFEL